MRTLLLFASFLLAQAGFSQDFNVPDAQLNTKEDYARYEKDVIAATKWLYAVPLNEQVEKRRKVAAFVFKWISGSPTVNAEITSYVLDFEIKNPTFSIMYMGSCARYVLENNYPTDVRSKQRAALRELIAYYKAGNGAKKDKNFERLVKSEEEGKLDEWMEKNLKL